MEREKRPHDGQGTVGVKLTDEAALAFCVDCLLCAAVICLVSPDRAQVFTDVCHAGQSRLQPPSCQGLF